MSITRRQLLVVLGSGLAMLAPGAAQAGVLLSSARRSAARQAARSGAARSSAAAAAPAGKARDIVISRSRHPEAAQHIEHAQRHGQPTVLQIDRTGAAERRAASTGSVHLQRKPAPHYERDEYPPAFVREGGHNANVRFIDRHDDRGAGAVMRAQTRDLPDGARIRIVIGD